MSNTRRLVTKSCATRPVVLSPAYDDSGLLILWCIIIVSMQFQSMIPLTKTNLRCKLHVWKGFPPVALLLLVHMRRLNNPSLPHGDGFRTIIKTSKSVRPRTIRQKNKHTCRLREQTCPSQLPDRVAEQATVLRQGEVAAGCRLPRVVHGGAQKESRAGPLAHAPRISTGIVADDFVLWHAEQSPPCLREPLKHRTFLSRPVRMSLSHPWSGDSRFREQNLTGSASFIFVMLHPLHPNYKAL